MKPLVITRILAPTDLSESSLPALRYARLFADHFSAGLTVMYTDPIVYPVDSFGREHEQQLRAYVERQMRPLMGDWPYDILTTVGQPIPAILAAAKEHGADLIVVGAHLRHGWRRALLGSVSDGVLHGSECPVLIVPTRDGHAGALPNAMANIVCPVNFTDVARESVRVAGRLAEVFAARLTVVHAIEADEVADAAADEQRVRQWVAPELQDRCSFREVVVRGGPAERVLDCAEDVGADLLVVGAQQKRFRDATVIGTTSERLIRFASCPVLVVPRPVSRKRPAAAEVREQPFARWSVGR